MDASESLLKQDTVIQRGDLEQEQLFLKPAPSGVRCDIVNECQMFLKAEDGGGDAHTSVPEEANAGTSGMLL